MLRVITERFRQGFRTGKFPLEEPKLPPRFRGLPRFEGECPSGCRACEQLCPFGACAVREGKMVMDLGRCLFCADCPACPQGRIAFGNDYRLAVRGRQDLLYSGAAYPLAEPLEPARLKLFGRSLKLRQVSAGGCNACELELNASANVNFDLQRFGIEWVASPRHADALVLTGPLTRTMKDAVQIAWDAMPEPRFLVAVGACTISGGLHDSPSADRGFLERVGPSLYVPGCPPHPLTFVNAILDLIGVD